MLNFLIMVKSNSELLQENEELRRQVKLLERSRSELMDAIESTSDAFFSIDENWMLTSLNSTHERITQIPYGQQIGKSYYELFAPTSEDFVVEFQKAMKEKTPVKFEAFSKRGEIWASVNAYPRKDGGLWVFYRDITEERNAREILVNNQKWLEYVVHEIPVPIYMVNPKTRLYSFGNKAMHELFGRNIPVGEDRKNIAKELVAYEEGTRRKMDLEEYPSSRAMRGEVVKDYRFIWRVRERDYHVSVTAHIIPDLFGNPSMIMVAITDVTDQVNAKNQVEQSANELLIEKATLAETIDALQKEREVRDRFVMALTHDLRTPLAAVKMSAQLLLRKPDNVDMVKTVSNRIANSIDRSDKMIRDLLDANLIKAGGVVPLQIEACELLQIVNEAIFELSNIHGERFKVICDKQDIHGFWDGNSLLRIIENLASNGVKYGAINTLVTIKVTRIKNNYVEIAVHNFGEPIPAEVHDTIFSQFTRTHQALVSGQVGWGVGLTLVKGIVEAHGGLVRLESPSADGTTFFIEIPMDARK